MNHTCCLESLPNEMLSQGMQKRDQKNDAGENKAWGRGISMGSPGLLLVTKEDRNWMEELEAEV